MTAFVQDSRVRDRKWRGQFTGTVRRVDDDSVYVVWDGGFVEDQMGSDEVEALEGQPERLWLCPDPPCDRAVFQPEQPPPCGDHPLQPMEEVEP